MIVVGRRGGPGGNEVQAADRLGRQPTRRRGRGHGLLDGDVPSPMDADRQVLLAEGDDAPSQAAQDPLALRISLEVEADPDPEPKHERPNPLPGRRIAWAKLMARVGEGFPLESPNCGSDIRLIAFITEREG